MPHASCWRRAQDVKDLNTELERQRGRVAKLQALVSERGLEDRAVLQAKLEEAEATLAESKRRVEELERHLENLEKNYKHETVSEARANREIKQRIKLLEESNRRLTFELKV